MNTTSDSQNSSQQQNTTIQITKVQMPQSGPNETNNNTGYSGNPPICKDFLNGKCSRPRCKYLHVVTSYKPTEPKPILNQLFSHGKGNVFINLTNFAQQQQYNGLFLCNLGDIIHAEFLDKLFASSIPHSGEKTMRAMITNEVITNQIAHKMQKVIEWTLASSQVFDKTNYSTIFIYDISNSVSNWVLKSKLAKHNNTWVMKYILNCLNMLFTCIYDSMPPRFVESINLYVSYLNDELNLTNRGSLDFIYGLVTATPGKYIGNYFHANIYYLGALPNLDEPISNPVNAGFIYCYLTRTKYINLADILTGPEPGPEPSFGSNTGPGHEPSFGSNTGPGPEPSFGITWQGDIQTGNYINDYNCELSKHNTFVYQNLFEKNSQLKSALSNTIPISNIRPKSLVIIGCNLDVEFDRGLVAGLKETAGAIDFGSILSKHGVGNATKNNSSTTGSTNNSSQVKKTSDSTGSCGPSGGILNDDTPTTTTTMSVIMPIFGGGGSGNSQQPSATQLNEMMRDLLGGMFTGKLSGNNGTTRLIQNRVCTIGINLIKTFAGEISTNQPFDTITGIEKIKEYGADPTNKIIILCSPRMTHEFFSDFIKQITRTPEYPVRISANFIDFDINPSLRKCLAYYNYRMMRNSYNSSLHTEVPITQMCRLHHKFMNYLNSITPCSTVEKHCDLAGSPKNTMPNECCNCCSCLSRNGIGYTRFGHLPYIPLEQLNQIKDDSWLPRY